MKILLILLVIINPILYFAFRVEKSACVKLGLFTAWLGFYHLLCSSPELNSAPIPISKTYLWASGIGFAFIWLFLKAADIGIIKTHDPSESEDSDQYWDPSKKWIPWNYWNKNK